MSIVPTYKQIFFCALAFIFSNIIHAQQLSLQISPGLMNYGGDLQNKVYTFQQSNFSLGAGVIYSINKISLRARLTYGKIKGDDLHNTKFKDRNLSFASNIGEASLTLEYDLHLLDETQKFTPYIFAGVGLFHFNPYTFYDSQKVYLRPVGTEGQGLAAYPDKKLYPLTQFAIPIGIGIKYKISDRIILGLEFSSRFLFTDYIDDVSGKYPDENELFKQRGQRAVDLSFRGNEIDPSLQFPSGKIRGNPNHNDNYYTSSFSFIYVLPQGSLFSSGKKSRNYKSMDCPKNVQ